MTMPALLVTSATLRRLCPALLLTFGLTACTPSAGETTPSGPGAGSGGVNVDRTGGSSGANANTGGSSTQGSSSGGGSSGTSTGGSTGSAGGSVGTGGSAGGGKGGGSGGGSATSDASTGSATEVASTETAPSSGGSGDWVVCGGTAFKPGISAMEFCTKYGEICGFAGGADRYASAADCMTKYAALSDGAMGGKACVAWHTCIAASPGSKDTFCPHAPQASAMSGPCKAAYLY